MNYAFLWFGFVPQFTQFRAALKHTRSNFGSLFFTGGVHWGAKSEDCESCHREIEKYFFTYKKSLFAIQVKYDCCHFYCFLSPAGREIIKGIPCVCASGCVCRVRVYVTYLKRAVHHTGCFSLALSKFYDLIAYVFSFDAVFLDLGP